MEPMELHELPSGAGVIASTDQFDQSQRTLAVLVSPIATNGNTPEDVVDYTRHESSLGQVDGGFQAWSLVRPIPSHGFPCTAECNRHFQVVSAFLVEALIWGYPGSYGVLLTAYLQDPNFNTQSHASTLLPLVGNLCTGIMYMSGELVRLMRSGTGLTTLSALVVYPTMHWYPRIRRVYTWAGTLLCSASLIIASFTHRVCMHLKASMFG